MTNDERTRSKRSSEGSGFNRRDVLRTGGALTTAGLLAGCSGGGGGGGDGGSGDGGSGGGGTETATPSLKERAQKEGKVNLAQSTSGMKKFYKNFSDKYGIKTNLFRTDSKKMSSRLIQEANAGKHNFDVIGTSNTPAVMNKLVKEGVIGQMPKGAIEDTPARPAMDRSLGLVFVNKALTMLYNKDMVDNPPKTLDELFQDKWKGKVTVDVRDSELLLAARQKFDGDEQKVKEFCQKLGDIATWRSSHFDAAKQCARGEVAMSFSYAKYNYYDWGGPIEETKVEGLPITGGPAYFGMDPKGPHPDAGAFTLQHIYNNLTGYFKDTINPDLYFEPSKADESGLWYLPVEKADDIDQEKLDKTWKDYTGLKNK